MGITRFKKSQKVFRRIYTRQIESFTPYAIRVRHRSGYTAEIQKTFKGKNGGSFLFRPLRFSRRSSGHLRHAAAALRLPGSFRLSKGSGSGSKRDLRRKRNPGQGQAFQSNGSILQSMLLHQRTVEMRNQEMRLLPRSSCTYLDEQR